MHLNSTLVCVYRYYRIRQNFRGWYAIDHSRETFCNCLAPCHRVLCETYGISYLAKICVKIFAIECKIVKTAKVFPLEGFAVYGILKY